MRSTGASMTTPSPPDAATVTAGRGHRIADGDVIISRRNDPAIGVTTPAT